MPYRRAKSGGVYKVKKGSKSRKKTYRTKAAALRAKGGTRKSTTRRRTKRGILKHRRLRPTCKYCGRKHSASRHKFHGKGSYARTHRRR